MITIRAEHAVAWRDVDHELLSDAVTILARPTPPLVAVTTVTIADKHGDGRIELARAPGRLDHTDHDNVSMRWLPKPKWSAHN